jgi:hypothetical protein
MPGGKPVACHMLKSVSLAQSQQSCTRDEQTIYRKRLAAFLRAAGDGEPQ